MQPVIAHCHWISSRKDVSCMRLIGDRRKQLMAGQGGPPKMQIWSCHSRNLRLLNDFLTSTTNSKLRVTHNAAHGLTSLPPTSCSTFRWMDQLTTPLDRLCYSRLCPTPWAVSSACSTLPKLLLNHLLFGWHPLLLPGLACGSCLQVRLFCPTGPHELDSLTHLCAQNMPCASC